MTDSAEGRLAIRQDKGARPYQEDAVGYSPSASNGDGIDFVVLADGMGGHAGGAEASDIAVRAALTSFGDGTGPITDRLSAALEQANNAIAEAKRIKSEFQEMGCTFLAIAVEGSDYYWISVGDSVLWEIDGDEIRRRNADHSMASTLADLVAEGRMTAEAAAKDPRRNALLSAVMGEPIDEVDLVGQPYPIGHDTVLILASDGLDTLEPDEILQVVRKGPIQAERIAGDLIRETLNVRSPTQDNVSVAVFLGAVDDSITRSTLRRGRAMPFAASHGSMALKVAVGVLLLLAIAAIIAAWLLRDGSTSQVPSEPISAADASTPSPGVVQPPEEASLVPQDEGIASEMPREEATASTAPAVETLSATAAPEPALPAPSASPSQDDAASGPAAVGQEEAAIGDVSPAPSLASKAEADGPVGD